MSNLNRVMLIGNLTRTPELRTVGNGAQVCELGLAINRNWTEPDGQRREEVTYVDITVWGRTAENAAKFLTKGRSVFVEGRLQLDTWKDAQTGQDRSKLRVIGDRLQFLGGAGSHEQSSEASEPAGESTPGGAATPSSPQRGRYQQRRAA
ncbi:MAG: single-stranded DNA-binding protein [Verrucomicrobiales bacterium]|nr:single-stranded DNA-binding protein [Verrucomicrobiales bacterium]